MSEKVKYFAREATGLTRTIGTMDALVLNLSLMSLGYLCVYIVFGPATFFGANMMVALGIGLLINLILGVLYYMFSITMPRTGGDYVFVSRVVHPAVGLLSNFWLVVILLTAIGIVSVWLVVDGIAALLWSLGTVMGDAGLLSLYSVLMEPSIQMIAAIIIVILMTAVLLAGTRTYIRITWVLFTIMILGMITTLATMLIVGHSGFVEGFESISGTTIENVISAARAAGYPSGVNWSNTSLAVTFMMLNFVGAFWSVYFAGEVREVRKTQLYGIFGAFLVFTVVGLAIYGTLYSVIGFDAVNALAYTSAIGDPSYTIPVMPYAHQLIVFFTNNPVLIFLAAMVFIGSNLCNNMCMVFNASRMLFAWSFDRIIPPGFSDLDKRFNAPWKIILLIAIISIISIPIYLYTAAFDYLMYSITGYAIIYFIASVAAIVFPYTRKDIFQDASPIVQSKIGGIPVISILGVVSAIFSVYIGYSTLTPAYLGGPLQAEYLWPVLIITILGPIIYGISYYANKRKGIDLNQTFKMIPPL